MKNIACLFLISLSFVLSLYAQNTPAILEDWESGDFSSMLWERLGTQYQWEITSEGAHSGRYCARSGNYYTLNTESVLQVSVYLTGAGTISYYRKVFSAEGSGGFLFWLDGELRDSLAGYVDWSEFHCPITSGFHVLKFCYTKNQRASKGSDCVWIDDISLPQGITIAPTPNDSTSNTEEVVIFDDVEEHVFGAINSPGPIGWTYIDGDAAPTHTFDVLEYPNEGSPMAFVVLDDYLLVGNYYNVTAHSGHKFFGTPYHSNMANDDWIISPELDFAEPFTFSFYARSFSDRFFDEKFVATYSITNTDAESFIPLHCDTITTTPVWTEYSFTVPAAAKHVAVHCISNDQYMFCLDDLTIRGRRTSRQTGMTVVASNTDNSTDDYVVEKQVRDIMQYELQPFDRDVSNSHMANTLEEMLRWNKYPTYEVYTQLLQYFQDNFPELCEIDTILEDTPHPDLHHSIFAIHISNTLGQPTTKPAFLYSSTMHGQEVVCYYMMLHLADYILNNATTDTAVQRLLENVDLYICPVENPDGTYHLTNDLIINDGVHSTYHNYNDVQLNLNYPYLPGLVDTANIQPETQAIIDWVTPIHFVMSVNFHCGAEIVNYPWDTWTTAQHDHADSDWFRYTGQNYASLCQAQDSAYFYGDYRGRSVIEGADWCQLIGGRQDYMTYYQRCREVTIEMSSLPVITDTVLLPTYWDKNKDALLSYAVECSYGFWGTVTDATTGEPVEAMIKVLNHDKFHSEVFSHLPLGAYHRPIMAGTYTVEVSAPCYRTETFTVTTRPGVGIRHDVELQPQTAIPMAFDQYILSGMQTTLVALAQNEVFWFESDTASESIASGNYYTTPVLFDTTTYYIEERFVDDTLVCISPRNSVSVYVLDTIGNNIQVENIDSQSVIVFPNPTRDFLTIESNRMDFSNIAIYDINGRLIFRKEQPTKRIDVSALSSGTYFLRMETSDGEVNIAKFVKEE